MTSLTDAFRPILCHRHVQDIGWEEREWGQSPTRVSSRRCAYSLAGAWERHGVRALSPRHTQRLRTVVHLCIHHGHLRVLCISAWATGVGGGAGEGGQEGQPCLATTASGPWRVDARPCHPS